MTFKKYIEDKLKTKSAGDLKKILFIDGFDARAQHSSLLHKEDQILEPILLFETHEEVKDFTGTNIIVMEDWKDKENLLVQKYVERRKGKEDEEAAKKAIKVKAIFAMLMIELGEVDGVIGGLIDPTANILKAAFKVVGPKQGTKTISSVMVMERGEEWYIFTDISVNISPNTDQLVEIAQNASSFAEAIDFSQKVAFLSFSTAGSAVHERSTFVKDATNKFNQNSNQHEAIGEVQFDAAFSSKVREMKYKKLGFEGKPTIFVFPSLEAANIGYKIAQRMGGFGAIGPIITGVAKPVNDLSRGATTEDVYNTALVTALQTFEK